ncbi:agamous-like MADS-box protein AGL61 [Punica granatum]|nr:agamous-like MADS-box protein AGL61 [Punica granatum]
MKRIEDDDDRLVTFSKRRSGIYKKASELVTLCGAEVGVVIFSPRGKPFSFGHPSIQAVANRFLNRNITSVSDHKIQTMVDAHQRMRMDQNVEYLNQLVDLLDAEKNRGKTLSRIARATREGRSHAHWELGWWEQPLDELSLHELKKVALSMEAFYRDLRNCLNHPIDVASLSLPNPMADLTAIDDPANVKEVQD